VIVTTGAISRAKLQSNHHHQQTNTHLFPGRMTFLSPNQRCQNTEGKIHHIRETVHKLTKYTTHTVTLSQVPRVTGCGRQHLLKYCKYKLCRRPPPQYAPAPVSLNFGALKLLTVKVVSESCVTWATAVPILVFLGLSVLDLGPMFATNVRRRQTDRRQTASSLMPPLRGGGITSG